MQQQDQPEITDAAEKTEQEPIVPPGDSAEQEPPAGNEVGDGATTASQRRRDGFDRLALGVALLIAAFFALTARFNGQPSPSFIPAAVFSATGCGLLVTALRKLRGRSGAGLREAALAGFGMALFQFAIALTYPSVFTTITTVPDYGHAFLLTWGLVGLFTVALSLAGAAIGHLVFAPLRPLPAKAVQQAEEEENEEESEEVEESASTQPEQVSELAGAETSETPQTEASSQEELEEEGEEAQVAPGGTQPRRPLASYVIAILLLGLLPMMAGYVFAAAYDFIMSAINVNQISPALYPTLSLLSGLLPWRLAVPINLSSSQGSFIVFTLLWRIPDSVLGNPNLFDVQALEAYVFNAAGLAFLLITMYGSDHEEGKRRPAPASIFILLEALLGLILVLPANLWILRGLEGVLQIQNLVAQLPTLQLINPMLFVFNLLTGALFCVLIGLIVRRQYQLWTQPRKNV